MTKKSKVTTPKKPTCGVREGGIGMPCELAPGHEGSHKNRRATFADPPPPSQTEQPKRSKKSAAVEPPRCPERHATGGRCFLKPGHQGEHFDGNWNWSSIHPSSSNVVPRPQDDDEGDDPFEDEVRSDEDRAFARQQREAREAHARELEQPEPIATSGLRIGTWRVHPAALIFPTPEEQYRQVVESIRTEGQKHPVELIVDPVGGYLVIDGCSRIRACDELGLEVRTKVISVDNPYKHVIAVNLARRHLDESQRAMAAAELATMEHGANQHSRTGEFAGPQLTQAEAAKMLGVGERTVRDAAKVKREAVPEVAAAVREGKLKVSAGAELAKLSPAKQREVLGRVTKGKGEVKGGKIRALVKQEEKRAVVAKINKDQVRPMPLGPFRLIVADYPWPYENSDQHDGSRGHITYPPMPIDDILRHAKVDLARAAHDDCILALWVTNHFVHVIGSVIEAAGFTHRTMITWDKMHAGVGTWPRGQTEHLVLASRGDPIHTLNEITTLYREPPRPEHSRKPDGLLELLAKHCPGPHLELFAREQRAGWASWGAEVDKFKPEAA